MSATDQILAHFEQISAIPRGTKNEAGIREWLTHWATSRGLSSKTDSIGNLVIYVPASTGRENAPALILQGHLDMVCEKTPDSTHDFTRDPIHIIRDGDWLKADKTTLGADNGIAIAIAMALVEDESISHPPLELLFTVEEEAGIGGADYIDPSLLTAKVLINLDSEEDGVFTIGCAGGGSTYITLPVSWSEPPKDDITFELAVSGLQGGHSGEDINKHRGNANKILARTLDEVQRTIPIRLSKFKGGNARNAIPRDAEAIFLCSKELSELCKEIITAFEKILLAEFIGSEQGPFLVLLGKQSSVESAISFEDTKKSIQLISALPNGVAEMSAEVEGFIETSNNIGVMELLEDGFHVISNQRSSVFSRLEEMNRRTEAIAALAGAKTERTKMFPPWQANMDSPLLKKCIEVYEELNHQRPLVELSHGGLECGTISDRCNGLDTISLGPTIKNPHSPDEMLYVPSLSSTWNFLVALLRSI
ncbi:MAG: aminoacyl-histidine dipeptidase [Anaerolineales bacterium]|nr:aminoacyl-histidine dipeptidase [Anaerolineales bacterium]